NRGETLGLERSCDRARRIADTHHDLPIRPVRGRWRGHAEFPRFAGIGELNLNVVSQSTYLRVAPKLARHVRVVVNLVGWAVDDVDASAVGLPAGNTRREVLVRVGDAPVVFLLE